MKTKLLIAYQSMFIGGSTTALISFLSAIDYDKYEVDLQLFKKYGDLIDFVPDKVNILPLADKKFNALKKIIISLFTGTLFKAFIYNLFHKRSGLNSEYLEDCQVKYFTKTSTKEYDYAIGYMEGWANKYVAYNVNSKVKYAWLHSTLNNITAHKELLYRWANKVDKIVLVSEAVKRDFTDQLPELSDKLMVLENLLVDEAVKNQSEVQIKDEDYHMIVAKKKFKICTVCRIDFYVKGIDRIITTAQRLKKEGYDFLWYIVGGGENLEQLRSIIAQHKLDDCLIAIGKKFNPYPYIVLADIFVLASRVEGKPICITESMILGVPPIVTRYLSASEQIIDGETGLICDNSDECIYYAIEKCISDVKLLQGIRANLRKYNFGNKEYYKVIEKGLF